MSEGLLYDTIKEMKKKIERLEIEVQQLKNRAQTSLFEPKSNERDYPGEILALIQSHWETNKIGIQMRHVSQIYSRRLEAEGGLRALLAQMEANGKISSLRTYSGAMLLFPREAYSLLTPKGIDDIVYAGLSEAQRERLRARGQAAKEVADGPSEAELAAANAEALKKFGAQQ